MLLAIDPDGSASLALTDSLLLLGSMSTPLHEHDNPTSR
jgi:hypothetical protein